MLHTKNNKLDSSGNSRRVSGIEGLRAIAVLSVLLSHWAPGYVYLYNWGTAGVYVFFFISGYVITAGLISEKIKEGKVNVVNFYARRAFRIWPIYFISLGFFIFFDSGQPIFGIWWHLTFLSNFLFAIDGIHFPVHLWTLSVEQQFYLLWPVIFILTTNKSRVFICLLFLISGMISKLFFLIKTMR
ncbi:MAG: O-acetyltransferase OatA [Candidatus Erwinia impunctatus]|nr:O-acetyltransferase OatA [Culicoides impunctatus]